MAGGNAAIGPSGVGGVPAQGSGSMGVNGLYQYGLFINAAPSTTQLQQGYFQFTVGTPLATNIWIPTNSMIVNFDLHVIGTFAGATTPTINVGTSANNGSNTFFINALAIPTTGAGVQIQTQGITAAQYNVTNFTNPVINPTGNPMASTALNTTTSGVTLPVFNLTMTINGSAVPTTASIYMVVEYAYFGSQGPTGNTGP
jgi:hypothetical protein